MADIYSRYREARYSRQILVPGIGEDGQESIMNGKAAVIGLGALGSTIANILARAGVGTLRLVDRDFVDWTNLQRQGLYDEADAAHSLPKAVAAREHLFRINSEINYEAIVDDVNPGNVEKIVAGASVVVDGLDNFYTRTLINEACVKLGIPWIHGTCVSTHGAVATIIPGKTSCYNCILPDASNMTSPYTCDTVGILGPVAFVVASLEASEALKILAGRKNEILRKMMFFDLWDNEVTCVSIPRNRECPVCARREFLLLQQHDHVMTSPVCGRDAIQVLPDASRVFSFESTLRALSEAFPVEFNQYLLRLHCGEHEIVLFRDGRAIVFGTSDPKVAKSLYARYIGG
ncbi:MAG: ThiF family adenylyltransferase [Bacillota bacterium]